MFLSMSRVGHLPLYAHLGTQEAPRLAERTLVSRAACCFLCLGITLCTGSCLLYALQNFGVGNQIVHIHHPQPQPTRRPVQKSVVQRAALLRRDRTTRTLDTAHAFAVFPHWKKSDGTLDSNAALLDLILIVSHLSHADGADD